jgi:hypothetical protein
MNIGSLPEKKVLTGDLNAGKEQQLSPLCE